MTDDVAKLAREASEEIWKDVRIQHSVLKLTEVITRIFSPAMSAKDAEIERLRAELETSLAQQRELNKFTHNAQNKAEAAEAERDRLRELLTEVHKAMIDYQWDSEGVVPPPRTTGETRMLVLSRKRNEVLVIGTATVRVLSVTGNRVKVGIVAPKEVQVRRGELKAKP